MRWPLLAVTSAVIALAGCGGGGGDSGTSNFNSAAADQSLSGTVIDGPIQGASVCLDLNGNGLCDPGEPTSGATNAQGNYTITGLTAAQVASGAALIAVIPATAVDAGNPTGTVGTAYKLSAPAGMGALITPITTLVQAGVAQGLTRGAAEAAVATQLQVSVTSLYNNYTTSKDGDNATLASVVPTVVQSFQAGYTPIVAAPAAATGGYTVRSLNFTNPGNFDLRYYYGNNVPDASGLFTFFDEHEVMSGGVAVPFAYDTALFATPTHGWVNESATTPNTNTGGSPNVTYWHSGAVYASARLDTDVSGQTLASVVAKIQDLTVNTTNTLVGVDPTSLSGVFPAGSVIRKYITTQTSAPVGYRVSDGHLNFGTLAAMVEAYPVPAAPAGDNTVSAANLHGSAACGQASCPQERLRVAFGPSNAVSYYLCDLDTVTNTSSNCGLVGTGSYSVGTAVDGTTPIMTLANLPAVADVQTFTRVYVQRNGVVYYGWQDKLTTAVQTRLTRVAFETLAAALGIVPPTVNPTPSAYVGVWTASYSGGDTGSCGTIVIDATGALTGSCVSAGVGGSFSLNGSVSSTGVASFTANGVTVSGATFSGNFSGSTGSGTWIWNALGGSWTASKQ